MVAAPSESMYCWASQLFVSIFQLTLVSSPTSNHAPLTLCSRHFSVTMGEYASPYHGLSLTLHLLSKSIRSTAELLHVSNTNTNTNSPAKKRRAVILPNTFTNPKESLEAKSDADIPTLKPAAPTVNADDVDFDNLESTVAVDSMTGYCCRISHAGECSGLTLTRLWKTD